MRWPIRAQSRDLMPASAALSAAIVVAAVWLFGPAPCFAQSMSMSSPSQFASNARAALLSSLDGLSRSGSKGMVLYAVGFLFWTMTMGMTTPIETAAGMAFPLSKAIPLSLVGKIGGALGAYLLTKYVLTDWVRSKIMSVDDGTSNVTDGDNQCEVDSAKCSKYGEWMIKIDKSFESNPLGVALIWRFSPLPEIVKNIGPALSPKSRTQHQILATLLHGVPFTVLWSVMGHEAGLVARGGKESVILKRLVAGIMWVGLVVSPSAFGWWLKSLGEDGDK